MKPGCTALTRTPRGPYSTATALVSIRTPPLDAWYAVEAGEPPTAEIEMMFTNEAPPGTPARGTAGLAGPLPGPLAPTVDPLIPDPPMSSPSPGPHPGEITG